MGVTGFPTLQLFHKGRVFHFAGKARDAAVLVDFARAGQGLTLVHFSAQLERAVWDRGLRVRVV